MTREEAKTVFLNRGYVEVEGGTIYDADKWRESCRVISEWLEQELCDVPDTNDGKMSKNPTGSKDVIWYSKRNYSEIEVAEPQENEDKCKNCEYYRNPDYTRCHECKVESEVRNEPKTKS